MLLLHLFDLPRFNLFSRRMDSPRQQNHAVLATALGAAAAVVAFPSALVFIVGVPVGHPVAAVLRVTESRFSQTQQSDRVPLSLRNPHINV